MPTTPLVWLPEGLEITSVSETPEELLVRVTSNRSCSLCPLCSTPSDAIHSYYRRKPADLPCAGRPIRLLLTVRKFFCRNAACPRKVFTERLPELLEPASRLTTRLREALQTVGRVLRCCANVCSMLSKASAFPSWQSPDDRCHKFSRASPESWESQIIHGR